MRWEEGDEDIGWWWMYVIDWYILLVKTSLSY